MNIKYFRCSWKYVFLMYRKNPRKWNYWWNKFRSEDLQQHVLQVFSKKFANKVFLVSLRFTEQLVFGKTFYIDVSYIIITYPIFSNSYKKVSLHLSWKYPIEFKYLFLLEYRFAWRQRCKFPKEILQMTIWLENVFKEYLMLQFSWLEGFRLGMVSVWWALNEHQYENGLKL